MELSDKDFTVLLLKMLIDHLSIDWVLNHVYDKARKSNQSVDKKIENVTKRIIHLDEKLQNTSDWLSNGTDSENEPEMLDGDGQVSQMDKTVEASSVDKIRKLNCSYFYIE